MNKHRLIILLTGLMMFQYTRAQDVKLSYRTFCIDLGIKEGNRIIQDTVFTFVKDDHMSVKVQKDIFEEAYFKDKQGSFFFDIADKKTKSYKSSVIVAVKESNDILSFDVLTKTKWKKGKDIIKRYYKRINQETKKKDKLKIKYLKDTKTIGKYLCNKAIIDGQTIVWYTKAIDYNWVFPTYYHLIPGTVVLEEIAENGTVVFELLSVEKQISPVLNFTGWE